MTLLRLALSSHRGGFAATTAVAMLFGLLNALAYAQLAGSDPAQRVVFARQMELLGRELSYILPIPVQLDTVAGYLQWRVFGTIPLIFGFWALLAASGAGRGDEERGLVETWLAAGVSRLRYIAMRSLAFMLMAAAAAAAMMGATWAGAAIAGEPIGVGALALQGIDLLALAFFCFAFSLLVAQVTGTRRAAGGFAGIALLGLFLVNGASRTGGLEGLARLSPFWAYDRSTPLLRGGSLDVAAVGALLASAFALLAVAISAFAARDLGASLLRGTARTGARRTLPSRDPLVRLPVLALLEQQRGWVVGWMAGLAVAATFLVSLTRTIVDSTLAIPSMRTYLERLGSAGYETFVATTWGSTALLLLSLFAVFQVSGWIADDAEGRLETVLAQPVGRVRVTLERLASLAVATALLVAAGTAAAWLAAARADIALSVDRFLAGSLLMITVPSAFGAVGAVVASWRPRAAVALLAAVAIASYFLQQFAPLFDWPSWMARLSIFALYGTPMATGVDGPGVVTLLAVGLAGTALAAVLFERRDVGR